jgi:ABC-2 type transport system permease protein
LAIGSFAGPNSATGIVNAVCMPMGFLGGLQHFAPLLPSYHFGQIALAIVGAPAQGSVSTHMEALVGFGLVFAGVAWMAQSRDHERMYG